jgi:hypothetical protein
MPFVTKAEAFVISELKSTVMDRLHMGGSFLQQVPTVTVGGLPVAIKQAGGNLAAAAGQLGSAISAVQAAGGALTDLVQNPMGALTSAVGGQVTELTSKLGDITSKLDISQQSAISGALGTLTSAIGTFNNHANNLSGITSAVSDTVPDLKKLMDSGNTLKSLAGQSAESFIANTASALYSDKHINSINDSLQYTIAAKMNQIKKLDANTDAAQIATLVTEISDTINNHANSVTDIVDSDIHNYNEASNNITATSTVMSMASQYADTESISYALMNRVGKSDTLTAFNSAIDSSKTE